MMIEPKNFFEALSRRGIAFYAGVPDSLLANFCAYVDDQHQGHVITANEGNAVAVAMGYHLSTGKVGAVYMQNSGLGNAVNPLVSLADPEVYSIPMLLIIGWRGEPEVKDEPQHVKQGRITLQQLEVLEIPYWVVDAMSDTNEVLNAAFSAMTERSAPVALVIRRDTFAKYKPQKESPQASTLMREAALEELLLLCAKEDLIVSTTGKTSREVFELRVKHQIPQRDFLTVGGMGHSSSIALGVAMGQPDRRVICFDGDGALLMHMGSMPVIADVQPKKFLHVLLNNQSHESVGGQATSAHVIDFSTLANALGYKGYAMANNLEDLRKAWRELSEVEGPVLLEVKICNGSRGNLGRPTGTAEENKRAFMEAANVS